jgi:putative polyhydroxyalkanoate system protein
MPKIEIKQKHQVTADEAKKRIDSLKTELGEKYGLNSKWVSDSEAKVERTGATGTIKIHPQHIDVLLDLSFALTPLKGKIESKIKEELEKLFKV